MFPSVVGYDPLEKSVSVVEKSEIVVGIPSRNVAHTIAYVLKQVATGLNRYYGGRKSSIIVCDGLSSDGTVDVVRALSSRLEVPVTIIPNLRAPGKGSAVRTIIELVSNYSDADVLLLIDSDLRSIVPEWIPLLVEASVECGFASPLYRRHRFDATITNFVARPLTSMAYGVDLKQPIGGDFGLSRGLVDILANSILWVSAPWIQLFGVDIFLTHTALANNIGVCEALLKAKIHEAKDPSRSLKDMFIEVTGSLFTVLIEYRDSWIHRHVAELEEPPLIKEPEAPGIQPWEVKMDLENTRKNYHHGLSEYRSYYEGILSRETYSMLYSNKTYSEGVDGDLWSRIVAEFFKAFTREPSVTMREALLETLYPLWQGRLYRYYSEAAELSDDEVEELFLKEVELFLDKRECFVEAFTQ